MPKGNGEEPRTLDPTPVDQIKSEWMLKNLGVDVLARLRPPVDTEKPAPGTLQGLDLRGKAPTPEVQLRSTATLREALKESFAQQFDKLPEGARKVRIDELTELRKQFLAAATPGDMPEHIREMSRLLTVLGDAFDNTSKEIEELELLRTSLRETLSPIAPLTPAPGLTLVPGATADDLVAALLKHQRILDAIADGEAAPDALQPVHSTIAELGVEMQRAGQRVAERRLRKEKVETDAQDVRLHPEALANALDTERQAVTGALATLPLADAALLDAESKLELLRKAANVLNEKTGKVVAKRDEYRKQLQTTVDSLKTGSLIPSEKLEEQRLACDQLLKNIQAESEIDKFPAELGKLRTAARSAGVLAMGKDRQSGKAKLLEYLKLEVAALELEAKALASNPNADPALVKELTFKKLNASKALDPGTRGTVEDVADGYLKAVATYRQAVQVARLGASEKTALIAVDRDVLLARIGKPDPKGVALEFSEPLAGLRGEVRGLLEDPLTKERVANANGRTAAFERMLLAAAKDVADAAEVEASRSRASKIYAEILSKARQPVQAELKAALQSAETSAAKTGKARNMEAARQLYAALEKLLQRARDEIDTAVATKATYLEGVKLGKDPIDPTTLEAAYDLLGPDALKSLLQAKGGARNIETVCVALKAGGAAVKQFYEEALSGDAKALASLVRGCGGGGGNQLKAVADSFSDKADCQRLGALIKSGGLAENPDCLADLLSFGVDPQGTPEEQSDQRGKNAAKLKNLGTAFGDKSGPAALKGLLVDGGLGARPSKDKPGVMAELLQSGCDGNPAKLREFANAYAGSDGEAVDKRRNLKTLIDKGGFGDYPSSLGPLVKSAGPVRLQGIGEAFAAPSDAAKLRTLLASGGMSGDTAEVGHEHEHPDTLAKVFVDGFKASPSELKKFAVTFQGHPAQCKQMLDAWNEYPKGKANNRQPGRQIAKLLSKEHLNGNVESLQKKFTTKMQQIPIGKRGVALRMAPGFDSEPGPETGKQPANMGGGELISKYILERHSPKHAQKGLLDAQNSYFPAGTDDSKLAAIITEALNQPNAPTPGNSARVVCPTAGLTVEIAIKPNGNICHCFPTRGSPPPDPNEIAMFTSAESTAIFEAVQ